MLHVFYHIWERKKILFFHPAKFSSWALKIHLRGAWVVQWVVSNS